MNLGISSFVGDVLLFLRNFQKKICIQCPQILLYFILIICLNTSFSYLHQYSMEPFNLRQFIFLQLDEIYYYFFKYCLLSFVSLSRGPHVDVGPICYTPSAVTSSIQSLLLRFPLRMPSCSSSGCSPTWCHLTWSSAVYVLLLIPSPSTTVLLQFNIYTFFFFVIPCLVTMSILTP